jgi:2-haloacid dehalogenase
MLSNSDALLFRPKCILFDVYETILDLSDVQQRVNSFLNSSKGFKLWFGLFMQYCFVCNSTNQYQPFVDIAKATMTLTANMLGVQLTENKQEEILWLLKHLPLKSDVQESLSLLSDEGFELAALTNSPMSTVAERMQPTGLISYFQFVMSAEELKKYKPAVEVFEKAVQKSGFLANQVLMVSSHGWDLIGAHSAGLQTAYIGKPKLFYSLAPTPNYNALNVLDLATQLKLLMA